jgi:hypothetical protein
MVGVGPQKAGKCREDALVPGGCLRAETATQESDEVVVSVSFVPGGETGFLSQLERNRDVNCSNPNAESRQHFAAPKTRNF